MPKPAWSITRNSQNCNMNAAWWKRRNACDPPSGPTYDPLCDSGDESADLPKIRCRRFATAGTSSARPRSVGAKIRVPFRVMPESATLHQPELHLRT